MIDLYNIQPASCRASLPKKDFTGLYWYEYLRDEYPHIQRVLEFDPTPIYEKIVSGEIKNKFERQEFSPFKRYNNCYTEIIFPTLGKICSCGCGKELKGRQRRWASESCSSFANAVTQILAGQQPTVSKYIDWYIAGCYDDVPCVMCGDMEESLEYDHIYPVHKGGGLCWLSNYQPLCKSCHKDKTKRDNRQTRSEKKKQLRLF